MCIDSSCPRRKSPGKFNKVHIRADNWKVGLHKNCLSDLCDCSICKKVEEALYNLSAPHPDNEVIYQRVESTNEDFTAHKERFIARIEYDYDKPFEEHSHIKRYKYNEFNEMKPIFIPIHKLDVTHPVRIQAKKDYEERQS